MRMLGKKRLCNDHVPHLRRLVFVPILPRAGPQRVRLGL